VKICRMKFNCSNANAGVREDYYFLSIYIARKKICIYTYLHRMDNVIVVERARG
jgi:hypothetical protein